MLIFSISHILHNFFIVLNVIRIVVMIFNDVGGELYTDTRNKTTNFIIKLYMRDCE